MADRIWAVKVNLASLRFHSVKEEFGSESGEVAEPNGPESNAVDALVVYFQSTVIFPSWTSPVRIRSPAPESTSYGHSKKPAFHCIPLRSPLPGCHADDFRLAQHRLFQLPRLDRPILEGGLGVLLDRHAHPVTPLIGRHLRIQLQPMSDAGVGCPHHPKVHPHQAVASEFRSDMIVQQGVPP